MLASDPAQQGAHGAQARHLFAVSPAAEQEPAASHFVQAAPALRGASFHARSGFL
ncbi:hypothetical protein [Roseateles sp.]|uniref:hypothetical protein n=1 Tax=Roseateles sp. TaxID=1971397 RepID=UPI00359FB4EE